MEFGYNDFIFLRTGIINIQKVKSEVDATSESWTFQPNFGLGLVLGNFTIDYALTNIGNVSQVLISNVFSLKINLKTKKKES